MTSPRSALLLSGLISFVALGAGMAITGAALPVFERTYGIDTATSGLVVSTLWIACLAGVVTMYFVSERVTPRMALGGVVAGAALMALAPTWGVMLTGAAVYGFGYGMVAAVFNPRLMVSWEESGPSKVSMLNAVFSAGAIVAPWAFGLIGSAPQPIFWSMVVVGSLGWISAGKAKTVGRIKRAEGGGLKVDPVILGFALIGVGCEASLAGLGPTALIRAGAGEAQAAGLLALFFIAALVARVALVAMAHRLADFAVYLIAIAWAFVCALGAAMVSAQVFFPLMGISAGLFFQGAFVPATRRMGDDPRVSPIILGLGLVGASIGPMVFVRLMDDFGPLGFFWLVAGVTGVATLAAMGAWRRIMA
jgi:MFS family permease